MCPTRRLLPRRVRDGLHAVHVVHCDLALWAGSLGLMPWLTGGVWSRVRWVARLEFLWEEVEQVGVGVWFQFVDFFQDLLGSCSMVAFSFWVRCWCCAVLCYCCRCWCWCTCS